MKKIPVYLGVLAIALSLVAIFLAKSSSELVYVDVNKLVEGYKKTKVVKADFEKKANAAKSNIDTLIGSWQKELLAFEKERASMSAKENKLKEQLLASKQQQVNDYQEAIQKKMQEEDQKITQTVINDINDYVKDYGKKHGYKIIFGASGGGNIMYAAESTDLTAEILEGLNADYEKK